MQDDGRTTNAPADAPDPEGTRHTVAVPPEAAGDRLDKVLAAAVPDLSRSRAQALLEQGHVRSDGRTITDASQRVKPGQTFEVLVPAAEPAVPEAQEIPLTVVHEDADVLVLDKPPGLVVHPAAGNADGTLVNALLAHCGDSLSGIGGVRRPGIVHRLDKDTSGLMVVAKNDRAHHALTEQFSDRSLSRTYQALVWGVPSPKQGRIEGNIGRHPTDRKRMAVLESGGKHAATRYRVLRAFGRTAALVECTLETGRTHQIRVHMAHIGHPVVGDPLYGRGRAARAGGAHASNAPEPQRGALVGFPRQALHAVGIAFRHPASGESVRFGVGLPADIADLIAALEGL
ncbi:RluA family pseudouridine synthase [Azospirillum sp.]|uniref:RluA family pseudouridine synthase n=1 Tax=Azospirillum sp. TaxID=34012 RepID=UPI002D691344|nr:RluA family pseudouridine synthase [Azospirillum sp.]HYD65823.1 RluA family pseudouridine synthase [Azospirillum sp.]